MQHFKIIIGSTLIDKELINNIIALAVIIVLSWAGRSVGGRAVYCRSCKHYHGRFDRMFQSPYNYLGVFHSSRHKVQWDWHALSVGRCLLLMTRHLRQHHKSLTESRLLLIVWNWYQYNSGLQLKFHFLLAVEDQFCCKHEL